MATRFADLENWSGTVDERLDHLTSAVGDLSQGQRAAAFDVREIKAAVARVEHTQTDHGDRLDRIEQAVTEHGEILRGHGELLRAILARLNEQ